jgi:signal transduction histidine kinase
VALGGRIKVESRRLGGHVVIEISHDGVREPGSALDQLFVPFASGPGGRPSLGLAERIVREHGGEIRTRSEGEWSAVVAFALPVRENQDRRRAPGERRAVAHDRRMRFPESLGG